MDQPQTYATHRALPRLPFMAAMLVLFANVVVSVVALIRHPELGSAWTVVVALALVVGIYFGRRHAQIMQDRIIRLEMRWRLTQLLPVERHADIARLTLRQLVALRFASDAELPSLVERTLSGALPTGDAIKRAITQWQGDHLRV